MGCTPYPNGTTYCISTVTTTTHTGNVQSAAFGIPAFYWIIALSVVAVLAIAFFALFIIRVWGEGPWIRGLWHYNGPAIALGNDDYHLQFLRAVRLRRNLYMYKIKNRIYLFRTGGKAYTTTGGPRIFMGNSTAGFAIPFPLLSFASRIKNFEGSGIEKPQDWENFVIQAYRQHLDESLLALRGDDARKTGLPTTGQMIKSAVPNVLGLNNVTGELNVENPTVEKSEEEVRIENEKNLLDAVVHNKEFFFIGSVKNSDGTQSQQAFHLPRPTLENKEELIARAEHYLIGENPQYFPEHIDLKDAVFFRNSLNDSDLESSYIEGYQKGKGDAGKDHTKLAVIGMAFFMMCVGAVIVISQLKVF